LRASCLLGLRVVADLAYVLEVTSAQAMIEDALRHQLFQKELQRRPSSG